MVECFHQGKKKLTFFEKAERIHCLMRVLVMSFYFLKHFVKTILILQCPWLS